MQSWSSSNVALTYSVCTIVQLYLLDRDIYFVWNGHILVLVTFVEWFQLHIKYSIIYGYVVGEKPSAVQRFGSRACITYGGNLHCFTKSCCCRMFQKSC